jgi:hypothetical protein
METKINSIKDKPGRSPKENMEVIVAIEDKPSENDI